MSGDTIKTSWQEEKEEDKHCTYGALSTSRDFSSMFRTGLRVYTFWHLVWLSADSHIYKPSNQKQLIFAVLNCKNVHQLAEFQKCGQRFNNGLVAPECFGQHMKHWVCLMYQLQMFFSIKLEDYTTWSFSSCLVIFTLLNTQIRSHL